MAVLTVSSAGFHQTRDWAFRSRRPFTEVIASIPLISVITDRRIIHNKKKWFPHNKGGSFIRWAGNRDYVVDWENNGERIKQTAIEKYLYLNGNPNFVVYDDGYYFHEDVSWSEIAMSNLVFRYYPDGFTFNVKGMSAFPTASYSLYELLAFCNSVVCSYYAKILNPSISFGVNSLARIPYLSGGNRVESIARGCTELSCVEWNSFETYQSDTLARIRTDYVHELQGRYRMPSTRRNGRLLEPPPLSASSSKSARTPSKPKLRNSASTRRKSTISLTR